jgi:hypothetical protein
MDRSASADRWRRLLNVPTVTDESTALESTALESVAVAPDDEPAERIKRAKEAMTRLVKDRLGGDSALLAAIEEMVLTSEQAVEVLESDDAEAPSDDQFAALEAVVAFDGTRPSFLVKDNQVDFNSSYNTGPWKTELHSYLDHLSRAIACVGRVELGTTHIGTGFLVTPTLAITNRHVAQSIASFDNNTIALKPNAHLDFGREQWNDRASFDRRKVEAILFAGKDPIARPVDHRKLDLAVLRVAPSALAGESGKRNLSVAKLTAIDFAGIGIVAAAGFPAAPGAYVPSTLKSKYDDVLKLLLEGDGGAKRFAPGVPDSFAGDSGPVKWTIAHDATTINGNSGSPVFVLASSGASPSVRLAGLHYGGDWGGERTNWAHLLAVTGGAVGYGGPKTFADFCQAEGIAL